MKFFETETGNKIHILRDEYYSYCGVKRGHFNTPNSYKTKRKMLYHLCYSCQTLINKRLDDKR